MTLVGGDICGIIWQSTGQRRKAKDPLPLPGVQRAQKLATAFHMDPSSELTTKLSLLATRRGLDITEVAGLDVDVSTDLLLDGGEFRC